MPKAATGEIRWNNGVAIARVTLRKKERASFALPYCRTDHEATERARLLAQLALRMRAANVPLDRARKAIDFVAEASARALPSHLTAVEELIGGKLELTGVPPVSTFKDIGDQWTSGELAKRYPDQIRVKRSVDADISRLALYVYPLIGSLPMHQVTLDACEEVMRALPEKLAPATRHRVGSLLARILRMAVYPLRLIAQSPLPRGFLPVARKQKALAYLYPEEDRRLMACARVPLHYRLLWGFLVREGMREGEALGLVWSDLDLARGAVRLDKNKTDDPRAWALNPGVAEALRLFRENHKRDTEPTSPVFTSPLGQPHSRYGLADLLRANLLEIGLHRERPELFATTPERRRIRVHDLRGTFVTIALANGKSESWISDRTGHRSSQMISRYKRNARTFDELHLGDLAPLHEAIPELAIAHGLPTEEQPSPAAIEKAERSPVGHGGFEPPANGLRMLVGDDSR